MSPEFRAPGAAAGWRWPGTLEPEAEGRETCETRVEGGGPRRGSRFADPHPIG
jgi:hypothetical protein